MQEVKVVRVRTAGNKEGPTKKCCIDGGGDTHTHRYGADRRGDEGEAEDAGD